MHNKLEKFATPIAIVVAGLFIGAGIVLSNLDLGTSNSAGTQAETGTPESLTELKSVKELGIKPKELLACITEKATEEKVRNDLQLASSAGLQGTPHMIVIMKDGTQFPIMGALPKELIEKAINDGKPLAEQAEILPADIAPQIITPEDHVAGNPETALATIVEYSDYNCRFCKQVPPPLQALVDEGKIAWVYRHAPVLGDNSVQKAIAAECVAKLSDSNGFKLYSTELMKQ